MAPNSLSPASVVVAYHSAYGAHRMTIPTREWFPTGITGALGSFLAWDLTTIDGELMITNLINELAAVLQSTCAFDFVTVYTKDDADAPNIPRASLPISIPGTSVSTGQSAAVSTSFLFKTTGNGIAKLVLLDSPIGSNWFAPILPASFGSLITDISDEFESASNAWSGRDDNRPDSCFKVTFDLNDKLQKQYFG